MFIEEVGAEISTDADNPLPPFCDPIRNHYQL
jgi:hypothetical protein